VKRKPRRLAEKLLNMTQRAFSYQCCISCRSIAEIAEDIEMRNLGSMPELIN
jgi:hypothetical protein